MSTRQQRMVAAEVTWLRPVATMVLAGLVVVPSLLEAAAGDATVVAVLARLALAIPVCAAIVWGATGVVLHYARVQDQTQTQTQTRTGVPADRGPTYDR